MVYSAKSDDINTISQFTRREDIKITTGGTPTPANYQVKLTIAYESEMQTSFQDIRFNTKAGGYIDYWIESKTDSVTATVWIELPDAITDPVSDTIWMFFGNAGLSDGGIGDDVFAFFDDFGGDLSKWTTVAGTPAIVSNKLELEINERIRTDNTYSSPVIADFKWTSASDKSSYFGFSSTDAYNDDVADIEAWVNNNLYTRTKNAGIATEVSREVGYTTTQISHISLIDSSNVKFEWDDKTQSVIHTTNIPNDPMYFYANSGAVAGTITQLYYLLIRKYITNEPTPSYGTAQHQRRIPQFIN